MSDFRSYHLNRFIAGILVVLACFFIYIFMPNGSFTGAITTEIYHNSSSQQYSHLQVKIVHKSVDTTFKEKDILQDVSERSTMDISQKLCNRTMISMYSKIKNDILGYIDGIDCESLFYGTNMQREVRDSLIGTPFTPLNNFKNPCWVSKLPENDHVDDNSFQKWHEARRYLSQPHPQDIIPWRIRCLPYALLIGVSKSGTTDLFSRVILHPQIWQPIRKELRFWNRQRIGYLKLARVKYRPMTFTDYTDCFDKAAYNILMSYEDMMQKKLFHPDITMEATPHYLWDYEGWEKIPGNRGLTEPRYILPHSLYAINPHFRFLVIIRNPVDRLYSQFLMLSKKSPPSVFHHLVGETLAIWKSCLERHTARACAYNASLIPHEYSHPGGMTLRASLYSIFLKDWLKIFPKEQFLVIKAEEYYSNMTSHLSEIFRFLGVNHLAGETLQLIKSKHVLNASRDKPRSKKPMWTITRKLLESFFEPYNRDLVNLLRDDRFMWKS